MTETTRLRMLLSGITVGRFFFFLYRFLMYRNLRRSFPSPGVGYLLGGIIPMIPYFIIKDSVLLALL